MTAMQDAVREFQRRQVDAVEAMIERMLVTPGDHGVVVYHWIDGTTAHSFVELSADAEPMRVTYADGPPPRTKSDTTSE